MEYSLTQLHKTKIQKNKKNSKVKIKTKKPKMQKALWAFLFYTSS